MTQPASKTKGVIYFSLSNRQVILHTSAFIKISHEDYRYAQDVKLLFRIHRKNGVPVVSAYDENDNPIGVKMVPNIFTDMNS